MILAVLIFVAGFAANRAARAIAVDTITAGFRKRVEFWAYEARFDRDGNLKGNWWRAKVHGLLTCPHCAGFWLSGSTAAWLWIFLNVGTWWLFPFAWWAVAGIQDVLTSVQSKADAAAALSAQTEKLVRNELQRRNARTDVP